MMRLFRLLKLFKMLRLVRLLHNTQIAKRLRSRAQLNPALVRLLELMLFLFLSWHWIGCMWWFIVIQDNPNADQLIRLPAWANTSPSNGIG